MQGLLCYEHGSLPCGGNEMRGLWQLQHQHRGTIAETNPYSRQEDRWSLLRTVGEKLTKSITLLLKLIHCRQISVKATSRNSKIKIQIHMFKNFVIRTPKWLQKIIPSSCYKNLEGGEQEEVVRTEYQTLSDSELDALTSQSSTRTGT